MNTRMISMAIVIALSLLMVGCVSKPVYSNDFGDLYWTSLESEQDGTVTISGIRLVPKSPTRADQLVLKLEVVERPASSSAGLAAEVVMEARGMVAKDGDCLYIPTVLAPQGRQYSAVVSFWKHGKGPATYSRSLLVE